MATQSTFHLIVASVGESRFDGAALSATLPTTAGEITVLPHHEPLVATLRPGTITVRLPGQGEALGEKKIQMEGGVLEISGNRAVVLL
jgi:F-type H+-transporting ATPase subunit epsilon